MRTISFLLVTLILFLATSCDEINDPVKKIDISLKSKQIVEADNAFGLDIFKLINAGEEKANFMISPLSLSMALSMAYNGAETETKAEMAQALRIEDFTRDEINESYKSLIAALIAVDPKVAMEIANSIWYKNGYSVEQNFLDVNSTYYNAEVNECDFVDPNTVDVMNQWVSDKTHEKIPSIITEIPPLAVLYLINAIYFNGSWSQEFNPENSMELPFTTEAGEIVSTNMMSRLDTVNYLNNETFSAIEMPYGIGNFNMMVLLPNNEKSIDDVIENFSPENWKKWQTDLKLTNDVDILFPKFKIEYELTLNDILMSMGMKLAFTSQADFSSINVNKDLFISYVKHKTFIEVDEEGTEAAAVTIIGFETTSIDPNEPQKINFHCTRPFLFAITEKDTGAILFMGKVGNPMETE
ncbi:MAG: serpin family protein [Prolixibacteraceae bacterium]